MKVAVIGSGLSGLTAGALLAQAGHQVTIYEQNKSIGGVTATLEQDGFKWDWGQMLITDMGEGEPVRQVLERLGVSDQVRVMKSYRGNVFPDFEIWRPEEYQGRDWRKKHLQHIFPEDAKGLDDYYRFYERVMDLFALFPRQDLWSKAKLLFNALPIKNKMGWNTQQLVDHYFKRNELHSVYSSILADYVTSTSAFPALVIPSINAENQYDERIPLDYGWHEHRPSWSYIINGMAQLVNALASAARNFGAKIITDATVSKVRLNDGSVSGIVLKDGTEQSVDSVIASGGARELFLDLVGCEFLPAEFLRKHVDNLSTTESVFMVNLGVNYDPSVHQHKAALCYYYLTYDVEEAIKRCQDRIYHEGKDGFVIYIPSVHSPEMAPPGHHAVTVYTIAPNDPVNGTWKSSKEKWTDELLNLAERFVPGLREHTVTQMILTPEDYKKRTHLAHHAFGGCPPRIDKTPPSHKTPIPGLYFVGAQSEAFGGVNGAITGAEKAVKLICK
jgi:phytoene dehydrogenase-like protein